MNSSPAGALALAAAGLAGGLLLLQSAVVARRPETHERVRAAMRSSIEAVPVQRSDLTGFLALSITAGVCEEVLFRGVLAWYLAGYLGHGARKRWQSWSRADRRGERACLAAPDVEAGRNAKGVRARTLAAHLLPG